MIFLFHFLNVSVLALSIFCIRKKQRPVLKYVGMLEVSFVGFSILLGLLMLFDLIEGNPDLYLQEISANRSLFIGITLLGIMNIVHVFLGAKAFLTK